MERENMKLHREVQENVAEEEQTDAKTAEIFAFFDEVGFGFVALLRIVHIHLPTSFFSVPIAWVVCPFPFVYAVCCAVVPGSEAVLSG